MYKGNCKMTGEIFSRFLAGRREWDDVIKVSKGKKSLPTKNTLPGKAAFQK
jgi:hypothetical protein